VDADGRGVLVDLGHDAFDTAEVMGSGVVVKADAVADVEHRQRLGGVDRLQRLLAGVDAVGDRGQMGVEFAGGDLVEQQSLRWGWRARVVAGRRGAGIQLPWRGRRGSGAGPAPGSLAHVREYRPGPGRSGQGPAACGSHGSPLAEESQQAAQEISGLIGAIQNETAAAVDVVEDGACKTADGAKVVEQARSAFLSIG